MIIINIKTKLAKTISLKDYTPEELYKIWKFYKIHRNFTVLTKY